MAEFERDIISERVKGRPPVSPMTIDKAKRLRAKGLSYRKVGKKLGISEGMVRKGLKNQWNNSGSQPL